MSWALYCEAFVLHQLHVLQVFIQGRANLNRAVHEDIVAVEILPDEQWACPSSVVTDDVTADEDEEQEGSEGMLVQVRHQWATLNCVANQQTDCALTVQYVINGSLLITVCVGNQQTDCALTVQYVKLNKGRYFRQFWSVKPFAQLWFRSFHLAVKWIVNRADAEIFSN